ncbi:MAG: delta-class carbonic anhydrase [Marinicellaceae bacterium]
MKKLKTILSASVMVALTTSCMAKKENVVDKEMKVPSISEQRSQLAANTKNKGFGPQSPRNIDSRTGNNNIAFMKSPKYQDMNLCNIHFHQNAEHKGGEFTTYAGDGNLKGMNTGFKYDGKLTMAEKKPVNAKVCDGKYGSLNSGDTIEVHYVHTSAQVKPGPTLGACLSDSIMNPQLRVETQVFVLVNDDSAYDFNTLTKHDVVNGKQQAINIPANYGTPVQYTGSTTGPGFNEVASPLQVSWSVRPQVAKLDINSVAQWCEGNIYNEDHAHGVRNLVVNPDLLSSF